MKDGVSVSEGRCRLSVNIGRFHEEMGLRSHQVRFNEDMSEPTDAGHDAADDYQYRDIPLMPAIIAELATELFSGKLMKRSDIIAGVVKTHEERGGRPSSADITAQMKKALQMLSKRELVESSAYGLWRFAESAHVASVFHADPSEDVEADPFEDIECPDAEFDNPIYVEQWVGDGAELVYVYSYPAYSHLAAERGEDSWPVKVGRSNSASMDRIMQQVGTGNPEWPVVHLAIRCQDSQGLERALHAILRLRKTHIPGAPGNEWFLASPDLIRDLLRSLLPDILDNN